MSTTSRPLRLIHGGKLTAANDPSRPPFTPAPALVLLPEERCTEPDWNEAWSEYLADAGVTLLEIARKIGADYAALLRMATREKWLRQRRDLLVARFGRMSRAA